MIVATVAEITAEKNKEDGLYGKDTSFARVSSEIDLCMEQAAMIPSTLGSQQEYEEFF